MPFFFAVYDGLHLGGQTIDADEAGGIALLIVTACSKGGDVLPVEGVGRPDSCIDEVALVQFQTHLAGDMLLQAFQLTFLPHIAADGDYKQSDATGFISIYGLPTKVQAIVNNEKEGK